MKIRKHSYIQHKSTTHAWIDGVLSGIVLAKIGHMMYVQIRQDRERRRLAEEWDDYDNVTAIH